MNHFLTRQKVGNQYVVSLLSVGIVAGSCLFTRDILDYKVVGYLLLVVVSLLAIFLEIIPVLLAALMSAVILNFLFIKPYYTLHIHSTEDTLLLLLFFVIALVNAVLTNRIRNAEQTAQNAEAKLNTMKLYNTLLDSLSHELRTPISTIMGAVGTLQGRAAGLSEDNQNRLLCEMEKASWRLNHQVENLLNMSRLETGVIRAKMDWCDLSELVYNVVNSLHEELQSHKVLVVAADYLPLFKLDYGLTEQILYNLLFNAAQYSPNGGKIEISIEYKPQVNFEYADDYQYTCAISISDSGPGIPESELDKVFDKFYRLNHTKTGGTGLGLSIVKGFTEAQGGVINASNNQSGGAVFRILFAAAVMETKNISDEY